MAQFCLAEFDNTAREVWRLLRLARDHRLFGRDDDARKCVDAAKGALSRLRKAAGLKKRRVEAHP